MLIRLRTAALVAICGLLLGCSPVWAQAPAPIPSSQTVLPIFQPVFKQLQAHTQIPIVLPTSIPTDALILSRSRLQPYIDVPVTGKGQFQQVSVFVLSSTKDAYELSLDATPNCQGSDRCSFGLLSGQQVYQDTPAISSEYDFEKQPDFQPLARSPESMGEVALTGGITGYFVPFVCGASCDTSKVIWEQSGYRYRVGIRMASKAAMIHFANSIIQNERQP